MGRRAIFVLLICLAALVCLWSVRRTSPRADFTYIGGAEPETLDPALITGALEGRLADALFEGLTTYDPKDLSPQPGMAERWELSADRLTYTFHLRSARWSNGDPVSAHDFVYSWRRVLEPATASRYAYMLYYLKNGEAYNKGKFSDPAQIGVKAADDRTLVVSLANPTPYFLDLTGFSTLLPVNRRCIEAHGDHWTRPEHIVTNGAFLLKAWRLNQYVRMAKNPDYWDAANVRLNTVDALAVENANTAFNLYLTGAADYTGTVPLPLRSLVQSRPDYHTGVYLATYYYLLNVHRKPLDDPRVRKALAMAIDKAQICRYITRGGEVPAQTFVPAGMPGYQGPKGLGFDVAAARRLLADAGFPDGKGFPHLQVLYNTSEANRDIAEVVQQMWKDNLNIRVELLNQEWKVYLDTTDRKEYDIARAAWIGDYTDPNTFMDMWVTGGGNNRAGWSNERYDGLIRRAGLEADPAKRMALFREAETILVEQEMPILPIYYFVTTEMFRPSVKGIHQNVRGMHPMKWICVE